MKLNPVITDYAMHAVNGLDLMAACRRIRPGQRVLAGSGSVDETVYRDAPAKPNRFLAKPCQTSQWVDVVKSVMAD